MPGCPLHVMEPIEGVAVMSRRLWGLLFLGACIVALAPAPRTDAEDERPARSAEALPSDLELVARSGGSFVTIRLADAMTSEVADNLPPSIKDELKESVRFVSNFFG